MRKRSEIQTAFADRIELANAKSFFLVGIGGAGMAGVAEMLHRRGFSVRGTDSTQSEVTDRLRALGIEVHIGHSGEFLKPGDAVVLTDAIDLDTSPEVTSARALGLPLFRRSQALGHLLKDHKVIAVTGTHGKTTTTGMTGAALQSAGLDPLIVVGAEVPQFGGAVVLGGGEWAVVEACEAYDSFHDLDPTIAVLTNLEADHLDFHGDYDQLRGSVHRFIERAEGGLVYCSMDEGASAAASDVDVPKRPYDATTFSASGLVPHAPGLHHQLNAGAAWLAAQMAGADPAAAAKGIANFGGAARRLQVIHDGPITVYDDYAHHPTEIKATIQALREKHLGRRLVVVFQPHLYTRTRDFLNEFAVALSDADLLVLTDIYPAREAPMPGMSSGRIAELVTCPVRHVPSRHALPKSVKKWVRDGDVVVGMGAGTITEFAPLFAAELQTKGKLSVWVAYGGDSAEREVSLNSGREVAAALSERGYDVRLVDFAEALLSPKPAMPAPKPDVIFLAVHGTHAEDGAIQGLCEILHIPYTGSGIQASSIAMDKHLTKSILADAGLPVIRGKTADCASQDHTIPGVERYVVKPNAQGSTVGLSFVEHARDLPKAVENALRYDGTALIEEWVEGMEISVPVLHDRALMPVEIVPPEGRYDFAAKYTPGSTEEICPARISKEMTERVQNYAIQAHNALKCEGATRTDMIISGDNVVILEVNTLPGMTSTSLLPLSAKQSGMSFGDLCEWILMDAVRRHG